MDSEQQGFGRSSIDNYPDDQEYALWMRFNGEKTVRLQIPMPLTSYQLEFIMEWLRKSLEYENSPHRRAILGLKDGTSE